MWTVSLQMRSRRVRHPLNREGARPWIAANRLKSRRHVSRQESGETNAAVERA